MHSAPQLSHLEILQYLYEAHRPYWKQNARYKNEKLRADLNADVSPSTITRALTNQSSTSWLTLALTDLNNRSRVANSLRLPTLFECHTAADIDRLIKGVAPSQLSNNSQCDKDDPYYNGIFLQYYFDYQIIESDDVQSPHRPHGTDEKGALNKLANFLISGEHDHIHWNASPWTGASFIAFSLFTNKYIRRKYKYICLIRPTSFDNPYRAQLYKLGDDIGVSADIADFASSLAHAINQEHILLIVCDACYVPTAEAYANKAVIRRLISAVGRMFVHGKPASLLTIGRSSFLDSLMRAKAPVSTSGRVSFDLSQSLQVARGQRFSLFQHEFHRFRRLRGSAHSEEGGSRLKRGYWHYENLSRAEVWPANIKLRAFFASNPDNYAYFDPTGGFSALCGNLRDIPLDISLYHDDILAYLRLVSRGKNRAELRSLRYCSTALHWLSQAALDDLSEPFLLGAETVVSRLTSTAFNKRVRDHSCPIYDRRRTQNHATFDRPSPADFTVGLGVRALVQEEWRNSEDQFSRAVAHWRVARRLFIEQDNKELLSREFPYEPHWGRSRIYFLGECIRHIIRATENYKEDDQAWIYTLATVVDNTVANAKNLEDYRRRLFPNAPIKTRLACNPDEVIIFCYEIIFQREINGNIPQQEYHPFDNFRRALAKRHGAFQMTADLLQLMSAGNVIGEPHKALPEHMRPAFIRDCGYALLDLGELSQARSCFQRLLDNYLSDPPIYVDALLSMSLVYAEQFNIRRAGEFVERARSYADEHMKNDRHYGTIRSRVEGRRANVSFLRDNTHETLAILRKLGFEGDEDNSLMDADLLHLKIACLARDQKTFERAIAICAEQAFNLSADGSQHEAISFRIALAHLFRNDGKIGTAEKVLGSVQKHVLQYGCAERTYLHLLLEGGRILGEMESIHRVIRAYASYLRPCFYRAKERGYHRYVHLSHRRIIQVLKNIESKFDTMSSDDWYIVIENAINEEKDHQKKDKPKTNGFFEVDPLFGYLIGNSIELIRSMSEKFIIIKEYELISNEFKEHGV